VFVFVFVCVCVCKRERDEDACAMRHGVFGCLRERERREGGGTVRERAIERGYRARKRFHSQTRVSNHFVCSFVPGGFTA